MIPPESKAKLEEMARAHVLNTYNIDMDRSVIDEIMWKDEAQDFLDGATAAWKMAVEWERKRCAGVVDWAIKLKPNERNTDTWEAIKEAILNPPKDEAEK